VFPPAYRQRFERRVRYGVAAAAIGATRPDFAVLNEALGASWEWLRPALQVARRVGGRRAPLLLLLMALRPWDCVPAMARHLAAWSAGSGLRLQANGAY
jgi:hypothetical protein